MRKIFAIYRAIMLGPHKRRPPTSPAVGATLVVARFIASGNRATTRVAPTSSFRRQLSVLIAFTKVRSLQLGKASDYAADTQLETHPIRLNAPA